MLVDTAHDAVFFFGSKGFGAEVVDAVVEAALDQILVHLDGGCQQAELHSNWPKESTHSHELLHLLLLHAGT